MHDGRHSVVRLKNVTQALVDKLEAMEEDLNDCIQMSAVHGMPYTGPNWGEEIEDAKAVLDDLKLEPAQEGIVRAYTHHDNRCVAVVHMSCSTDFVARNDEFKEFVDTVALHAAWYRPGVRSELLEESLIQDPQKTIAEYIEEQREYFGEDIRLIDVNVFRVEAPRTCKGE
jgi:hypothetical protein